MPGPRSSCGGPDGRPRSLSRPSGGRSSVSLPAAVGGWSRQNRGCLPGPRSPQRRGEQDPAVTSVWAKAGAGVFYYYSWSRALVGRVFAGVDAEGCRWLRRGPAGRSSYSQGPCREARGVQGPSPGTPGSGKGCREVWGWGRGRLPGPQTDGSNFQSRGAGLSCGRVRRGPRSVSRKQPQSRTRAQMQPSPLPRCSPRLCLFRDAGGPGRGFLKSEEAGSGDWRASAPGSRAHSEHTAWSAPPPGRGRGRGGGALRLPCRLLLGRP